MNAGFGLGFDRLPTQHFDDDKDDPTAIKRRNRQKIADAQEYADQRDKVQHQPGTLLQAALQKLSADLANADDAYRPCVPATERAVQQATRYRGDQLEGRGGRTNAV